MPLCIGKMTVNVSLCGAIPRSDIPSSPTSDATRGARLFREKLSDLTSSDLNSLRHGGANYSCLAAFSGSNGRAVFESDDRSTTSSDGPSLLTVSQSEDSQDTTMPAINNQSRNMTMAMVEPPRWAVPAKGEARLEPVCEALGSHNVVDLTSRSCFRIGRSPTSDVQLMHGTSSRRHALLFHHPNGSCYVVDCGSAHGTYVNGVRVRSTPSAGMVVPHRVRRGALIRFGGPGAPCFVLKSFSVGFSYMVKDLESPSSQPTMSPSTVDSQKEVAVNTRINSSTIHCIGILKKRSFDESDDEGSRKRRRCISPFSPESSPLRLVSPDPPSHPTRRVTFSDVPQAFCPNLITPDLSSSSSDDSEE